MHQTICFIGNRSATLEARLFSRVICRHVLSEPVRLITRCTTAVEMIAFEEWKRSAQPIDLVLPPEWTDAPTASQETIITTVRDGGGRLIVSKNAADDPHADLTTMIQAADLCLVMEITCDHPLLSSSQIHLNRDMSAAFQWAVSTAANSGCRLLLENGRVTPLFPPRFRQQLAAFIKGKPFFPETWTQPGLGI